MAEQGNTSFDNSGQVTLKATVAEDGKALEGLNVLTYEEHHDPLRALQTQQKRKFFPTMADDS